jgi:hypothetical protein
MLRDMKNRLIFALLGGVLLFIWQFMAWAMPAFHWDSISYTPLQTQLLEALDASGLETGMYVLGQPDPAAYAQEGLAEAQMQALEGKGYARINYIRNYGSDMVMNMVRGLFVCIIMAYLLHILLGNIRKDGLKERVLHAVGFGAVFFLFMPYTNFIWFKEPDIWAYVADAIIPWALLGALSVKFRKAVS